MDPTWRIIPVGKWLITMVKIGWQQKTTEQMASVPNISHLIVDIKQIPKHFYTKVPQVPIQSSPKKNIHKTNPQVNKWSFG